MQLIFENMYFWITEDASLQRKSICFWMTENSGFSRSLNRGKAAACSQRGSHTVRVGCRAKSSKSVKRLVLRCERGDSNPQGILLPLPPQGSVSTSSTTSAGRDKYSKEEQIWQNGF